MPCLPWQCWVCTDMFVYWVTGHKRKQKNWEKEDYYDSDEDTFLDRTGTGQYVCVCVCMCVCVCVCVRVRVWICTCVPVHTYVHVLSNRKSYKAGDALFVKFEGLFQ